MLTLNGSLKKIDEGERVAMEGEGGIVEVSMEEKDGAKSFIGEIGGGGTGGGDRARRKSTYG